MDREQIKINIAGIIFNEKDNDDDVIVDKLTDWVENQFDKYNATIDRLENIIEATKNII